MNSIRHVAGTMRFRGPRPFVARRFGWAASGALLVTAVASAASMTAACTVERVSPAPSYAPAPPPPAYEPAPVVVQPAPQPVAQPNEVIYESEPPPPPPVEVEAPPPPPPGPDFVWVNGYQRWEGHRYVYVRGRYDRRPHANARWEAAHWEARGRGRVWVEGRWR